ncbi:MAG: sulfite exporter TauE/SafE family protein [Chloroflexota bacterium]
MVFFAWSFLFTFLATMALAMTGFGFNLVLVPLLSLIYDPKATVVLALILGLVVKAPLFAQSYKLVQPRVIAPLTLASFVGSIGGARLILYADPALLRVIIGATVVFGCIPLLLNRRWQLKQTGPATAVVGLVSGVLASSTSMSGPPVILFGVNQAWPKETFRANLIGFFVFSDAFALALLIASGLFTQEMLTNTVLVLPAVAVGVLLGNAAFKRFSVGVFYRVVVLSVIVTGALGAYGGAAALLQH